MITPQDILDSIKGKEVFLRTVSIQFFNKPGTKAMAFACISDNSPNRILLDTISSWYTCREEFSTEIRRAHCGHTTGVTRGGGSVVVYPEMYLVDKPLLILLGEGFMEDNITHSLPLLHEIESLAGCGKSELIHPVKFSYIKYLNETKREEKIDLSLIIAPAFWGRTIPFLSAYLLLVRLVSILPMWTRETADDYFKRIFVGNHAANADSDRLIKILSVCKNMFTIIAKNWEPLSSNVKQWSNALGNEGINEINTNVHNRLEGKAAAELSTAHHILAKELSELVKLNNEERKDV